MSAPEFRALFNNPAFAHFYKQEISGKPTDSTSFLGIGRKESKTFVSNTVGDFILSKEQLTRFFNESTARKLLDAVKTDVSFSEVAVYRTSAGQEQIVFPQVKFSTVNSTISKYLDTIGKSVGKNNISLQLELFFEENPQDIGHIFGFTNTLLIRSKESARKYLLEAAGSQLKSARKIGDSRGIQEARDYLKNTIAQIRALDSFIDSMVDVLEEYDMKSSPIKGLDLDINTKYRKTSTNWAFTWEGSAAQQAEGQKLSTILGNINQTKSGGKGVRGLFATLGLKPKAEAVKEVLNNFIQEFVSKGVSSPASSKLNFLQQKASPSLLNLIEAGIKESFGVKNPYKDVYTGSVKLPSIPILKAKKVSNTPTKTKLKNIKNKVTAIKNAVRVEEANLKRLETRALLGGTDLVSLQALLNANLAQKIKENMGDGNRRDVLNLRLGRLAESAKVERLSESRQGMITAFYSYMRNPYGTFSDGGRQQYPRSRDPKLLISKSIREIAQSQVANRLRAVLI